ncbi:hypothetical protein D3C81_2240920 [compost metagenome]
MRRAEEGQRAEQPVLLHLGIIPGIQGDLGGDDIEPGIAHHHLGAAFGIGPGADGVRLATIVTDKLDPGSRLAVQ